MTFDGFYMHHMNQELTDLLLYGRVSKVQQPNAMELVLTIRAQRKNYKLLFNIMADAPRYQLTEASFINPEVPGNFCMLLRKYLEGAILTGISQRGLDRITTFAFHHHTELGDEEDVHLIVELMGKHSNIFLVEPASQKILDCMKHINLSKNSYRLVMPNATYSLPPYQDKLNFLDLDRKQLEQALPTEGTVASLQASFSGLSKPLAQWLLRGNLLDNFLRLKAMPRQAVYANKDFAAVALFEGHQTETLSQSLDLFYAEKAQKDRISQAYQYLFQRVTGILDKDKLKIKKLTKELERAENAEIYRIKGELLTANAYQVERGQTSVTLFNYYDNSQLDVALKPEKNAVQNAKDYFKRYQKLKQAVRILQEQLETTQAEIDYLESVLVQLNLTSLADLETIKYELIQTGYLKQRQKNGRPLKQPKAKPLAYQSSDGTSILVGRNNLQNDQLTLKTARKDYFWLHAKNIPGSHVIVEDSAPSMETLEEAAQIAAYHSKFQQSANVPVDYVQVRHIKKPNGAKPGFVIYEGQKTLYVTPIPETIKALQVKD